MEEEKWLREKWSKWREEKYQSVDLEHSSEVGLCADRRIYLI